ncbi:secreted phosphoprotein 24 [Chanos chanos]|uniref:Secreted phosphoprotein 24 n=1 Tax=Chanos chanos TaxID=29144 RepID=A0A6J2VUE3_CHACN|nr:secreted phosphoprotein 24 [Chanos chanos]
MKFRVLLLVLLQVLGGSGVPLFQLSTKADEGLRMALDQINTHHARVRLYKVSRASVKRVVPMGMNTYDLLLKFEVRETDCKKTSGVDPQGCSFRRSFFVSEASCQTRVRVAGEATQILTLKCGQPDSSSSESSSEEMGRGWFYDPNHFGSADPAPTAPQNFDSSVFLGRHQNRPNQDARGDNFSNHLE